MSQPRPIDPTELRDWLEHVRRKETAEFLMLGIAYAKGVSRTELADWYGIDREEVDSLIEELESDSLILPITRREGVDFEQLAAASGLSVRTIVDWFEALESQPVTRAANIIRRYGQRTRGPLLSGTESRIHYLDFEVISEHGWSIEEEDLFAKASHADLDTDEYGRFLVEPGQSILEAAEQRGHSWPYACRGGACANCAVIVTEGDIAMPGQAILSEDQVQTLNARLACVGVPVTEDVKLVKNVQHLEQLTDLRLPSPMADSTPSL